MNQKRLKIGIYIFMAAILLCAGRMVYVDAIAAKNNASSLQGAAKGAETVSGSAITIKGEMRAVWIYYNEVKKKATSYSKWKSYIDQTFDACKAKKMKDRKSVV